MNVLNVLAPVFLVIALGATLLRTGFFTAAFLREANRVTYWLGLPALLFSDLATSLHGAGQAGLMLGAMLGATAAVIVAGYLLGWAARSSASSLGTFVQAVFRGNLAFVGLPLITAWVATAEGVDSSARTAAVLVLAPVLVLYNVMGVVVLLASQHAMGWGMIKPLLRQLATTPPLIATLAGIGYALMGWTLPAAVHQSFQWLGNMALPLALLGVGGALLQVKLSSGWWLPCAAGLGKAVLSPLIGYAVGRWIGLTGVEMTMMLIFMATPTAAISYTMASQMKGDEGLASGAILFSTVFSIGSLGVILAVA